MKKKLLFTILCCISATLSAQAEGNVGINTVTPTAALHVQSKGNTATTQALKVDNADGTNLLTVNNDGTVSGLAAVNLSSGTPLTPKAAGIFSGRCLVPTNVYAPVKGYMSPVGNGFTSSPQTDNAPAFFAVAQTVPFDTVLDHFTFSLRSEIYVIPQGPVTVELYVNGQVAGVSVFLYENMFLPGVLYTSNPVSGAVTLHRGDVFAYRISTFISADINMYISSRYTEL